MALLRKRQYLIFLCSLAIVTVFHIQKEIFRTRLEEMVFYENIWTPESGVTCNFPILHPFDKSILGFIGVPPPVRCPSKNVVLTFLDDDGVLRFNASALDSIGYGAEASRLYCVYQEIWRAHEDDFRVVYGPEIQLTGRDVPASDFIYVSCSHSFTRFLVYQNFHAFARRNPSVRNFKADTELSAVVIGIDSMSRLNFMRQLSRSYQLITRQMNASVMLGFNKVGENTWPNVIPMLTGRPPPSLPYNKFKNWPFIWDDFAEDQAATMYSEDMPDFNMFDYLTDGIQKQPTLHYMRTFWLAVESSFMYKMSSTYCLGSTPKHTIFLNYLRSFLRTYRNSPVFLFSLFNELSHDYVNTVGALDKDLEKFLQECWEENLFNRSVVFVMGDHGNRIDPIRLTYVGKIEDRMPMVSVIVPEWFSKVYPLWKDNLEKNQRRLTSSYDLYATFREILSTLKNESKYMTSNPTSEENAEFLSVEDRLFSIQSTYLLEHFSQRSCGLSFFHPIPKTRDCPAAGVPSIFCTCDVASDEISVNDERSVIAAKKVVEYFNSQLLSNWSSSCAKHTLKTVLSSRIAVLPNLKQNTDYVVDVVIQTEPGSGIFEASVAHLKPHRQTRFGNLSDFHINKDIYRVNRYGSQADCLPRTVLADKPILKGTCYCIV